MFRHRYAACFALFLSLNFVHGAPASTIANNTVVLPPGASNHGNPKLICEPAKWTDVAVFFLGNYVAHAATVVLEPGTDTWGTAIITASALLLPGAGLFRAIRAMTTGSILAKDDLQAGARARALCTLVDQRKIHPQLFKAWFESGLLIRTSSNDVMDKRVHGTFQVPDNYFLTVLPRDAEFETVTAEPKSKTTLCTNYNALKVIVALAQVFFAATTLYNTKGDQIDRFGYAAFGLTVTPYLFMSVMNLIANFLRPDYPTLYLVESQDMAEAVANGAKINGTVGKLSTSFDDSLHVADEKSDKARKLLKALEKRRGPHGWAAAILGHLVPLAIIGGLTRFHKGHSTHSQRAWVMVWIILGAICGSILDAMSLDIATEDAYSSNDSVVCNTLFYAVFFAAPAIGGFVVVGQEIVSYGVCKEI